MKVRVAYTVDVDFCAVYENGLLDRVGTFAETTLVHIPLDEGGGGIVSRDDRLAHEGGAS